MTALLILRQSLMNLWLHPLAILRIIALPTALMMCCLGLMLWVVATLGIEAPRLVATVAFLVGAFAMLWVTVNLHRLFLLGEGTGWRPPLRLRTMLSYGAMLVPVVLVLFGVTLLLALLVARIRDDGTAFAASLVVDDAANILKTATMLRLTSLLPALALDRPLAGYRPGRLRGAGAILAISALMIVTAGAVALLQSHILPDPSGITSLPMAVVTVIATMLWTVLATVFNISLLSVLWGHYVDGRPLR